MEGRPYDTDTGVHVGVCGHTDKKKIAYAYNRQVFGSLRNSSSI